MRSGNSSISLGKKMHRNWKEEEHFLNLGRRTLPKPRRRWKTVLDMAVKY
jgi:hypothetical protein